VQIFPADSFSTLTSITSLRTVIKACLHHMATTRKLFWRLKMSFVTRFKSVS
jgi:hypothetical protein